MGKRGYGCTHYKQGCTFVIWKISFGKTLTDTMVKAIAEKGRTGVLKMQTEDGQDIRARIVLADPSTGKLSLEVEM